MGCGKALGKDGLWEGFGQGWVVGRLWVRMGCGKAFG